MNEAASAPGPSGSADAAPPRRPRTSRSGSRWLVLLGVLAVGCTHPIPRNRVSDFFAKDFELPDYRKDEDQLSRERHRIDPARSGVAAQLGDSAATFAGGFGEDWHASAAASLGAIGGTATSAALTHATQEEPLPKEYEGLELAVPIIQTDPNSGVTVGIMPISLFREGDRFTNIFAPQITYNAIDGEGALFRMRRYYRSDTKLEVDAGSTTNGAHTYDVQYRQAEIGPGHLLFFRGRFRYLTELTDRFFGLGNDSDKTDESNYTYRRTEGLAALGIDMPRSVASWLPLKIEFAELLSSTRIGPPHIQGLPSARAEFPDVPGMHDRIDLLAHRITLTLDTRDQPGATSSGFLVEGYYEIGDSTLASDFAFAKGGFTAQGVTPSYLDDFFAHDWFWISGGLATAGRVAVRFVGGRHVPFFEQTSLGGKTDLTPISGKMSLRGFGDGRFIDKNAYTIGLEERWNFLPRLQDKVAWLLGRRLFDNNCTLQIAAFAECGRVYGGGGGVDVLKHLHGDVGGAIRLIVPESDIVLSIDEGVSKEGTNTFVDLGYTF